MNKLKYYALSICLILGLMFYPNVEVKASNVSLGVSASTINIGDTVTVSVSVPENISATVDLTYSSDILSFSSASVDVNANGSTIMMNIGKYSLAASNTVSVTFTANTSGTASVSASVVSTVDNNDPNSSPALGGASTSITVANQVQQQPESTPPAEQPTTPSTDVQDTPVEEPKSGDNSLSSLKLSSGTLSPSFKYNVTNYTATVGYNVSNVVVSATPSNGKAIIESVTGNGNVNLEVGDNTIQIVVQAENGVKATYTVVVTRSAEGDAAPTPSESESESEAESEETPGTEEVLQWNGQTLQPVERIPNDVVPSDFTETTVMINSVEIPCLTFANGNLKVLYLQNEEGTDGLYVYDEAQKVVYPFVKLGTESNYIIVLLPDEATAPVTEYYKACTLSIEGKGVINAYQFVQPVSETPTENTGWFGTETFYAAEPVMTDFYLVYGINQAGETGWYVYDSIEGTIQRYLASVHNPVVEEDAVENVPENTEDYDKVLAELEAAKNMQLIIICVAVFVVVVLVIIIVNLILRRRSDETYEDFDEDYDDEDYDDDEEDEYYDEYDFKEDEDTTEESQVENVTTEAVEDKEIEIEFYEMPQEDSAVGFCVEADIEEDDEIEVEFYEMAEETADDEIEVEFYEMPEETADDEIEVEFYEMVEETVDDEVKVEFHEMTEETVDDEVEVEFYEMTEETTEDDEVEVEFYNMEDLLMKEAVAPEQETSKAEKETEIPEKNKQVEIPVPVEDIYMDDEEDDDLEFIDLD